jgi:NhaA family Na+:H+ antiporter
LPALGAVGSIAGPVGLYVFFNYGDAVGMNGWAIPAATDIAFALGILMLLGDRVPVSLKVFLVSLAIFDDLGAIVIIAIFYSSNLSIEALTVAAFCLLVLGYLNWRHVSAVPAYILVGLVMWVAVLKSGVHATLAGVVLAMFIPMRSKEEPDRSPLTELEHDLHTVVAFGVLPLFAFVNAGISFAGMSFADLLHPVSLGISLGLFAGKQMGVFLLCLIAIRLGMAKLPDGASWGALYGVAVLSGVGFTMSLFIDTLAFENLPADTVFDFDARLGILVGSLASGVLGYIVLDRSLPKIDSR